MSVDMAQFHQVFFEESFEGLGIMEAGLLEMDAGEVDSEQINAIFRAAHSIKGGAGTFGFMNISNFTHIMETLLDEMRDGRRQVTAEAVEALLRSVDVLRHMLQVASEGGEVDEESVAEQQAELQRILNNQGKAEEAPGAAATAPAADALADVKPEGWHVVFRPHLHMMRTGNDPVRIVRELCALGDAEVEADVSGVPPFAEFEPEDCYIIWDIRVKGDIAEEDVREIFEWVDDDCDLAIIPMVPKSAVQAPVAAQPAEPVAEAAQAEDTESTAGHLVPVERRRPSDRRQSDRRQGDRRGGTTAGAAAGASSSIRVDITKIDALINMVGELVITQSMLGMLGDEFSMDKLERLQEGLSQLERHTRELQASVMQIRMLPISFTFSRFPRLVHDLSNKLGKKVELKMIGEGTEVDKTVIEKIGDPLVHLVRNSLDHGLEGPEERRAAGKPETGTVELVAYHKGGNIVIEIRDDGRGLNADKILDKAIERGLVSEDDDLTNQQIYELIFQPGFSTADQVSDVSGRGVGMDVVRRNINELGGGIEIRSELGKGSSIIIRLPLTLAILDGQSIAVGDETYIVPLVSIIESIQVRPEMINLVAGRGETFKLRGEYLPIVRLHEAFGIESVRSRELTEGLLVVVEGEGRHCGLFVDDLLGQQQVVIKSLEANYKRVEGISGATILGDGSVALILDIPGLIRLAGTNDHVSGMKLSA